MTWLGHQCFALATCGSTSDEAARMARAGAAHGTIVVADRQTSGRGRLGRTWVSPPGNLYLSAVLRLPLPPAHVPGVTLAIGIGVCDAIRHFLPPDRRVDLKWPNDVVVAGPPATASAGASVPMSERPGPPAGALDGAIKKVAGVLVEAQSQGGRVDAVIAGIGVNLRGVPEELAGRAMALTELLTDDDPGPDRDAFVDVLLPVLATWIDRYVAAGAAMIVPAWEARMCPGLRVRVPAASPDAAIEGAALGLEPDGALQVRDDTGVIHFIRSGEAEAVHP
jgi:BirA family transcriptional regulator, biotin operon repressor / biotin---[acetyl-CoA-carboxylase] ligase